MTLPYELARELKEAGFPVATSPCLACFKNGPGSVCSDCFIPTLEELIESCGEKINLLVLGEHGWVASFYDSEIQKNNVHGGGKTPSEAVANLWLALNPRQNN